MRPARLDHELAFFTSRALHTMLNGQPPAICAPRTKAEEPPLEFALMPHESTRYGARPDLLEVSPH